MATDTYSARIGMLEMGTGNQNNSWGNSFNGSVTDVIDRAIAGVITRTNTGGTLDLSTNPPPAAMRQDIDAIQLFTGALTSHLTVIVPNLPKTWTFVNRTSGNFQLYVKTTAGGPTQVPQGTAKTLYCSGDDIVARVDGEFVGNFVHHGGTTAPPGSLACDGSSLLRADFPVLFNKISTTWGAVDGTHFTLPLLTDTGRFLRSSSGSLSVGTYQSNQNLAHTHTASASAVTGTTNDPGNHTHANSLSDPTHSHGIGGSGTSGWRIIGTAAANTGSAFVGIQLNNGTDGTIAIASSGTGIAINNAAAGAHTHTVTGTAAAQVIASQGGAEARPESAVVLICIKY